MKYQWCMNLWYFSKWVWYGLYLSTCSAYNVVVFRMHAKRVNALKCSAEMVIINADDYY